MEPIEDNQGVTHGSSYSVLVYNSQKLPEQYLPLVFSRWLRSFRYGNKIVKDWDSKDYYHHYHKYIEALLSKPDSTIRLAVLSDDHDVVLGFSVVREDVLDYVHVQVNHRKQGIAKKLVPDCITATTHTTDLARGIWKNNPNYRKWHIKPFV